ncbi:MAG TPA: hypothetical protein VKP30_20745 [Polyangiaceae bacterium]|nr:hypothetical protein [Polyangiaceae bacterium]
MKCRIWMIITSVAVAACGSASRSANFPEDGSNQTGVGGTSGKLDNMPPTTPLSEPNALPPGPPTALSSSPASPASPASPTPP